MSDEKPTCPGCELWTVRDADGLEPPRYFHRRGCEYQQRFACRVCGQPRYCGTHNDQNLDDED